MTEAAAGTWEIVVETPKGSHNKLKFDPERNAFRLSHVLPVGMSFPFDFGFLPETHGGDGDPPRRADPDGRTVSDGLSRRCSTDRGPRGRAARGERRSRPQRSPHRRGADLGDARRDSRAHGPCARPAGGRSRRSSTSTTASTGRTSVSCTGVAGGRRQHSREVRAGKRAPRDGAMTLRTYRKKRDFQKTPEPDVDPTGRPATTAANPEGRRPVRRPPPSGSPTPLRPPPRDRRRPRVMGRTTRSDPRSRRQTARRPGRGPSAWLLRFRGRDPQPASTAAGT